MGKAAVDVTAAAVHRVADADRYFTHLHIIVKLHNFYSIFSLIMYAINLVQLPIRC